MNNEELDSQLSAMLDNELPASECELLARRLSRDEVLKARWGRYATIGAVMRSERGAHLAGDVARRVSVALASEPALLVSPTSGTAQPARSRLRAWSQPVFGAAVAASVAAGAILWLRAQAPVVPMHALPLGTSVASALVRNDAVPTPADSAPPSYTVPTAVEQSSVYVPPAELADFVVAHSPFSTPFLRHNALSSLVTAESGTGNAASTRDMGRPITSDTRTSNADSPR
jgi:negative regulator of sigma E activity